MALANYPATQTQITFQHALPATAQALFWMINTSKITMKPLSKTYKELGIAFTFPITIRDTNGNTTYSEDSDGEWSKSEYNDNGKTTYFEDSDGDWYKYEYDDNGKTTYSEDSNGFWSKSQYDDNGKTTYYENSDGTKKGNSNSQSCAGKVIEVDGIKYKLTPVK